jgi:myo-inositol-1(or 4)-monophosphatase
MALHQHDLLCDACDLACALACEAGRVILSLRGRTAPSRKDDGSYVTQADHAAQQLIVDGLHQRFPDHRILAEESGSGAEGAPGTAWCWIIDPLDGTRNFVRGLDNFATSIGLVHEGRPILGVIRGHIGDYLYRAVRGGGAFLNDMPIQVALRPLDREFFVGVPSVRQGESPASLIRLVDRVNLRSSGSTALDLARVASGALDAATSNRCHCWDVAAGLVLITEAGGMLTAPDGSPFPSIPAPDDPGGRTPFLAANPEAHAAIRGLLT